MKYEVTSLQTKKMLAESLKNFLMKKPFSKITVSEIIRECGVNRKTFYYHFEDINDLLAWCFQEDFTAITDQFPLTSDFKQNLTLALDYIDANPYILKCIHDALGLIEFKKFLYKNYIPIVREHLTDQEKDIYKNIDTPYKDFLYSFGAYGFINLLLDQQNNLTPYSREELVNYIIMTYNYMLESAFSDILQKQEEENVFSERK